MDDGLPYRLTFYSLPIKWFYEPYMVNSCKGSESIYQRREQERYHVAKMEYV